MRERPSAKMKVTTVRFGHDLWGLLEDEAGRSGVPVSQFIRDAALARAVAAAAARGEGPFELLAGAVRDVVNRQGDLDRRREAERALDALAEATAGKRPGPQRGHSQETNVEYVARLWDAFRAGGVDEIAPHVPDDVEWHPSPAQARVLRGTEELRRYLATRDLELPEPEMFHAHRDDVVVQAELSAGERPTPLWLVCRFDGRRLTQAIAFENEAEALRPSRASARR